MIGIVDLERDDELIIQHQDSSRILNGDVETNQIVFQEEVNPERAVEVDQHEAIVAPPQMVLPVAPPPMVLPVLQPALPPASSVLLYGHSFTRRLNSYLIEKNGNYHNLGMSFQLADTTWFGLGGLTIDSARMNHLAIINLTAPEIVYLELGSNDLCYTDVTPWMAYRHMAALVTYLTNLGVKKIFIGQVLCRKGVGIPLSTPDYNRKVREFNTLLLNAYGHQPWAVAQYWKHRGLWNSRFDILCRDGIHLNKRGSARLYRSVRGAVLRGLRQLGYNINIPAYVPAN